MDRDEMSNLYRGPLMDASYQISVHLTNRFKRRRIRPKGEMGSANASYQIWVIWQSSFREEEFYKSTNQKQEFSVEAMFVNGSGNANVQMTFHGCFLPRFGAFG